MSFIFWRVFMKVKDYSYETFPRYTKDIEGALELKGNKENLRCRLRDVYYQDNCFIRFLFPNTVLDEQRKYPLIIQLIILSKHKDLQHNQKHDEKPLFLDNFL